MPTYSGERIDGKAIVWKGKQPLSPSRSRAMRNHSGTGFNWGYGGSGPAQLALALLLEETTERKALAHYQAFKRQVVAGWPDAWKITSSQIQDWLRAQEEQA